MTPSDKSRFKNLITDAMAFYRQDVSIFALSVWWQACELFDFEQVSRALTNHAVDPERGQFPPRPADVVRQLVGTSTERSAIAWGKVHEAMSRVGAYTDVVFDDAAIHAAIEDMGGWPKMCRTEIKDLGYLQHRFCEAHKAYVQRGQFDYPRCLGGDRSPDSEYEKKGLPVPRPAIIGNQELARLVYQGGGVGGKTEIVFQSVHALGSQIAALVTLPELAA